MTAKAPLITVILSGGTGSRLWPVSRETHPKPFIKLADQQTLLQKTFQRANALPNVAEIMTITNKEYYHKSKAEYEKNKHNCATSYILEPFARNTAPAIALAALKISNQYGQDAVMLVLPADHLITDTTAFTQQCELAYTLATTQSCMVIFGIRPTHPETGFGYIECGDPTSEAYQVKRFVEKPDAATAQSYIESGNYLWNAGMFCFKAGVILRELTEHAPEVMQQVKACWDALFELRSPDETKGVSSGLHQASELTEDEHDAKECMHLSSSSLPIEGRRGPRKVRSASTGMYVPEIGNDELDKCIYSAVNEVCEIPAELFQDMPSISIDYAVMEKSHNIKVLACDFGWHDIGSWEAYKKLHQADQHGNTILGDAILIDSQNNLVHSETRMVASIGISNLAIIDTPDALLITHRDRTQDVKQVVQTLKDKAHDSYHTHRTVMRPWGHYTVLEESAHYKIKRIVVHPGASLSLQYHEHRAEHWVVITGVAHVVNGDEEYTLQPNESAFVPMGTAHRLSNKENMNLVIIEVQTGHYVGEDDIIRLEDTYGRIK